MCKPSNRRLLKALVCLCVFPLAFINFRVACQHKEYIFRHITTENGLVNPIIWCMVQDSAGYMWIGTQTGLQRYDGYRFVNYTADFGNPDGLESDWISAVFEDSRHRLWVGADDGSAYTLNRNTGKFYNYNLHEIVSANKLSGVWNFCEDNEGGLWACAHNGIFKLNPVTNHFEKKSGLFGINDKVGASCMVRGGPGEIWVATTDGIELYDTRSQVLYNQQYNPLRLPLFNIPGGVSTVVFDGSNNLWFSASTGHTLYKYDIAQKKMQCLPVPRQHGATGRLRRAAGCKRYVCNKRGAVYCGRCY